MKEIVALITFLLIACPTMILALKGKMAPKMATVLLGFSLLSGFLIANYDLISKFRMGNVEVETAKRAIDEAKQSALADIEAEVKNQKESIQLLIASANDSRQKLEQQRVALTKLINTASQLQTKIEEQREATAALNQSALKSKAEIEKLNAASSQIALTLVRATYLTLATKNEFGGPRSQKATEQILDDLNAILPMVIPDQTQRAEWVKNLESILPKPK